MSGNVRKLHIIHNNILFTYLLYFVNSILNAVTGEHTIMFIFMLMLV